MSRHGELAEALFYQGYNCSQSVAAAFSREMGLSQADVLRMSAGFGAGMGRLREVCGAFSGMVFVFSTLYAAGTPEDKSRVYAEVQSLAARYREGAGGSIVCRALLGLSRAEGSPTASERTAEYYRKRPCPKLVHLAADILSDYLDTHPRPAQEAAGTSSGSR